MKLWDGDASPVKAMSHHFVQRWRERVGTEPTLEEVNALVNRSRKLRPQMRCYVDRYGTFKPYKVLAEFWNHERGVVVFVDEERATAVTVVAAGMGREEA